MYELDLTLRNNITTEEHPLGVYHPHEELHHIEKRNIGLIEVIGSRRSSCKTQRRDGTSKRIYHREKDIRSNDQIAKHADWTDAFLSEYDNVTEEISNRFWNRKSEKYFCKVLEDAGVYKCTDEGIKAFKRFISTL